MSMELPEPFEPADGESGGFDPLPPGEYTAEITEAEVKQPKSGNGYYVKLVWKILTGEYENRQVFQNVTYKHSSEQATKIGRKMLRILREALGIEETLTNVEVLLFKPAIIKLGIEKDETGQYDDKNKVLRVRSIDGSDGGGEDNSPQSTATAMPTPQGSPPTGEAAAKSQPAPNRPASPGPGGSAPWRKAS
jgi:hypothetical protein